jgi:4-hydroxythreonine-4-phosphate dehydrogenase
LASTWTPEDGWRPVLVAERAALEALRTVVEAVPWERLVYCRNRDELAAVADKGAAIAVLDPVGEWRSVRHGAPSGADARGALAALDRALELAREGAVDAMVTAPISKRSIADAVDPSFRGHTDYLAERCGLERYGRDYLMAFLAPDLRVALLTTHVSLRSALDALSSAGIAEAVRCIVAHAPRGRALRIAVAGVNPHAGEGGLMGHEDEEIVRPAVAQLRAEGLLVAGPESPDTVFVRARRGAFDWVLALYHDQGLIAVKTLGFGEATNWTLGLPILRTSVDHGTAYDLAGQGRADVAPLRAVIKTTLELIAARREQPGVVS